MNTPIDQYLGIVNPLLIITNLQVNLDLPILKAMCTTWLAVESHKVKVCEMFLKITLMISSLRIICTTAHEEIPTTDFRYYYPFEDLRQVSDVSVL